MPNYQSVSGVVVACEDFPMADAAARGCYKIMTVRGEGAEVARFVITPYTYFVAGFVVRPGSRVIAFYDADLPVPMIYPPQYRAVVVAQEKKAQNVAVDFFDANLVSGRGTLKLNIAPSTKVLLRNGQPFTQNPANHYLVAVYGAATRSMPAQTRPSEVVVLCTQP